MISTLLLLTVCSDNFDQFTGWQDGSRPGMEEAIVWQGGDSCLQLSTSQPTSDIVKHWPRPVLASERPFAVFHIYVPPFDQWPTGQNPSGSYNYCGARLTIQRANADPPYVWPGIFLSRNAGNPSLTVRVLQDHGGRGLETAGWWTLGIRASQQSEGAILAFYAAPGKVELTESDRFYTDSPEFNENGYQTYWPVEVASFDGWFLQCGFGTWFFGDVQLYADIQPALSISRAGDSVTLTTGYPGMTIERSEDLVSWLPLTGNSDSITQPQQFYRIQ